MLSDLSVPSNGVLSPEVVARSPRRQFTAEYKERILSELEHCQHGQAGLIMRREGLYASNVKKWRKELRAALTPQKRGPKQDADALLRKENERLVRENARLQRRIDQAEKIMEVQKKVAEILGVTLPENDYPRTNA